MRLTTRHSSILARWTARGSASGGQAPRRPTRPLLPCSNQPWLLLRREGALVVDPVELADADKLGEPEFAALTHEFKHDLNAYLAQLGGDHPG